jgi:hypothetical protein
MSVESDGIAAEEGPVNRSSSWVSPDLPHSLIDSGARADMLLKSAKFLQGECQLGANVNSGGARVAR